MNHEVFKRIHPDDFYRLHIQQDIRPDGRALHAPRKLSVTRGVLGAAADGSAMVKVGATTVLAGLTSTIVPATPTTTPTAAAPAVLAASAATSAPDPTRPAPAALDVRVELLPLCNAARRVRDREDEALRVERMLVAVLGAPGAGPDLDAVAHDVPAGYRWVLALRVYCIDHDGNVEDATVLAATAALLDLRLPVLEVEQGDEALGLVAGDGRDVALRWRAVGVPVTAGVFVNRQEDGTSTVCLLLDPTASEERVCSGHVTVVADAASGSVLLIDKPGGVAIPLGILRNAVALAQKRGKALATSIGLE